MNTKLHIAFMGGLLLGGCTLSDDQIETEFLDELDEPAEPLGNPANEIASEESEAETVAGLVIPPECIGAAVVAILDEPTASCEMRNMPANWMWRAMFEDGSPEVAALTSPVPQELQRFCIFEWVGAQPPKSLEEYFPMIAAINDHPNLDDSTIGVDCMGMSEQSALTDPDVTKALSESFLLNVDAVDASDLAATLPYQNPVRVEVVDSVSQKAVDNGIAPHNAHGLFMSALIGNLACPNGGSVCLDSIRHLLAMPRKDYQFPDWEKGESYGSKVDIAVQVYAAVQQWREDKLAHAPNATDRLVLNVSLGYQRVNPGVDDFNRGPQASLKTALDFAACHGALVFAASGNIRDENCPQNDIGPLAPGSFEGTVSAPTEEECHALGFDADWAVDFPVFGDKRPLVYAIGGVDPYDQPLPNSRTDSQPPLVALGTNAVGNDFSMAVTGTSISTAVTTATAQLLWMHDSRLTPDEVYMAMYKSAWDLGTVSDFGFSPGANTRRLSMCAALDYVCSDLGSPSTCPILGCTAQPPAPDGNLAGFFSTIDDVLHDPGTVIEEYDGITDWPVCDTALPSELVTPNPEMPICAVCGADIMTGTNNDKLSMSIAAPYKGSITNAMMMVQNTSGATTLISFPAGTIPSLNDSAVDVVNVNFNAPLNTKSAMLVFFMATGSQSNAVTLRFISS
jgi:hypothetical protein